MAKPNEYITDLFKKIREEISEIKHKLFVAKPKLESSAQPLEYSIEAVHENGEARKEPEGTKSGIVIRVNLPKTIDVKAETEERTKPWKQDRNFIVQIAAASIGVLVLVVYACQLGQMIKSNGLTRKSLVTSSRAWVAPANAYFTSEISKTVPFSFDVQYRNVGRSPALDVHPTYSLQQVPVSKFDDNTFNDFIETDEASTQCGALGTAPGADVVYPDQPDGYKFIFTNHLTGWINDGVVAGSTAVVLQMCFAYKTMDEIHHTSFCYFYRIGVSPPNKQMNICTAGNHAD
jgi:hypothetical protein